MTRAVRILRAANIAYTGYRYTYINGGGTAQFASEFGVDEHSVIKTLVLEDDRGEPLTVLMHGDQKVSTKTLARQLGVKAIQPCEPAVANRYSGYRVGGTSPFGTRREMPVYCQSSIAQLSRIYINGGSRGYMISMRTEDMLSLLKPNLLEFAQSNRA